MKINEVTRSCGEFATKLDAFVASIRRHAGAKFSRDLMALHKRRKKPLDGEVARAAILHGVKQSVPQLGVRITQFDPAPKAQHT